MRNFDEQPKLMKTVLIKGEATVEVHLSTWPDENTNPLSKAEGIEHVYLNGARLDKVIGRALLDAGMYQQAFTQFQTVKNVDGHSPRFHNLRHSTHHPAEQCKVTIIIQPIYPDELSVNGGTLADVLALAPAPAPEAEPDVPESVAQPEAE